MSECHENIFLVYGSLVQAVLCHAVCYRVKLGTISKREQHNIGDRIRSVSCRLTLLVQRHKLCGSFLVYPNGSRDPARGFQCADLCRDWNTTYCLCDFNSLYVHKSWRDNAVRRKRSIATHLTMSWLSYSSRQACHSRKYKIATAIFS